MPLPAADVLPQSSGAAFGGRPGDPGLGGVLGAQVHQHGSVTRPPTAPTLVFSKGVCTLLVRRGP